MEELAQIIADVQKESWGDLQRVIEKTKMIEISEENSYAVKGIRAQIIDRVQYLTVAEFEPITTIILSSKDADGNSRYSSEDIYYELPARHHILDLRNRIDWITDIEREELGWLDNGKKLKIYHPEYSDIETFAWCCFNEIGMANTAHRDYLFLTYGRQNVEFLRDCGIGSGAFLTDVIEMEDIDSFGLMFSKGNHNFTYIRERRLKKGYVNVHYFSNGEHKECLIREYYLSDRISPRFYCSLDEKYGEHTDANVLMPVRGKTCFFDKGSSYLCVDYSNPHNPDRKIAGDKRMKSCISRRILSQCYSGPVVYPPCIVVDLDLSTSIFIAKNIFEQEQTTLPIILDDHFVAYELAEDYISDESLEYRRYKIAVDELNKRLYKVFRDVESGLSNIPGKPFHLSLYEKMYIIDKYSEVIIKGCVGKMKTAMKQERPLILNPCGFDLKPYLDSLLNNGYIDVVNTPSGEFLKYRIKGKTTRISIVLFAFIMNERIAEAYSKLDNEQKKTWDNWYQSNGWREGYVHNSSNHWIRWREINGPKAKLEDFKRKVTLEINQTHQIRATYFENLFSMQEGQIRTMKSAAIKYQKDEELGVERRKIIEIVNDIE